MPAAPSSLTNLAIGQLLTAAQALRGGRERLLPARAAVPDPRARCGVRHRLAVILALALCAVLAGTRSLTAITEWPLMPSRPPRMPSASPRLGAAAHAR
jgi:hypothetical protein